MSNTPRPRTVTVTEQDVRRLAAIIYRDTFLLTQAFEFSRDFLASLPDAPAPEEKPMGFGYCPMCCHALNQCSHCDAPTEDPEPSHDFKPTEFGGDTCERCDKDVRSHLLADAFTKRIQAALEPGGSLYIDKYRPDFRITNLDPGLLDIIAPATVRIQIPRRPSE
jgi:hypothetical protein